MPLQQNIEEGSSYSSTECSRNDESSDEESSSSSYQDEFSDLPLEFSPISDTETSGEECQMAETSTLEPSAEMELSLQDATLTAPAYLSYKLVGDNIDKNVRPRFMRIKQHRSQSLHFFHSFAVLDRINTSCRIVGHSCTNLFTLSKEYS